MDNKQKQELRRIIKEIPQEDINTMSLGDLYRRHGSEFNYSTFYKYLRTFRKVILEKGGLNSFQD